MLLLLTPLAHAATLTVGDDAEYATISEAVDASAAGDVVDIAPGVYVESVHLAHDLTLQGAGADLTVLRNDGSEWIVSGNVGYTLADLTLDGDGRKVASCGLYLRETVLDRVVVENTTGNAIYLFGGGDMVVRDTTFRDHHGGAYSGSLLVSGGAVLIERSTFTDIDGHGLRIRGGTDVTVRDSTFVRSGAAGTSGAIDAYHIDGGTLTVERCAFEDNLGRFGAAARIDGWPDDIRIVDSRFVGNASDDGGAVNVELSVDIAVTVAGNLFADNTAAEGAGALHVGGGFYPNHAEPRIIGNTFAGNTGLEADHVYIAEARWGLVNNLFAGGDGVAVFAERRPHYANHNLYPSPERAGSGGDPGPNDVFGDPGFVSWTDDGDPSDDDVTLAPDSIAIDAGHPRWEDPDGTPSDIGAF